MNLCSEEVPILRVYWYLPVGLRHICRERERRKSVASFLAKETFNVSGDGSSLLVPHSCSSVDVDSMSAIEEDPRRNLTSRLLLLDCSE